MSWTRPLQVFTEATIALWLLEIIFRPIRSKLQH